MSLIFNHLRDFFCKLSGEDYTIISKCSSKIQFYYSLIGFFVFLILLFSFLSALYFTENLFHNVIADIGGGLVWGYIVTNIYILLLYTISPTLLPIKGNDQEMNIKRIELSFSMILRIFIVILLAIIIAQPLNVFILKSDTTVFVYDIKFLLSTNFFARIITLCVVILFLLPVYLKYSIRTFSEFYQKKAEIEKMIIESEYRDFKKKYSLLLESKISNYNKNVYKNISPFLTKLEQINPISYKIHFEQINDELAPEKIEKYEYWANSPYRTIHKTKKTNILSEKDLLEHIYSEKH